MWNDCAHWWEHCNCERKIRFFIIPLFFFFPNPHLSPYLYTALRTLLNFKTNLTKKKKKRKGGGQKYGWRSSTSNASSYVRQFALPTLGSANKRVGVGIFQPPFWCGAWISRENGVLCRYKIIDTRINIVIPSRSIEKLWGSSIGRRWPRLYFTRTRINEPWSK